MPTPSRTSLDAIVAAGRAMVDAESLDALTMERVATAVGVRAPSLYKRVRDRGGLVHLIANDVAKELGGLVAAAASTGDPRSDVRSMIDALRAFAHERPGSYALLFERLPDAWRADRELVERAVEPLFRAVAELAGQGQELEAARTIVAWARGFIDMELADAFKLGGDVEAAYDYGVGRLIHAIAAPATEARPIRRRVPPDR
jgi:AcrR family transcriptional regulator